MAKPKTPDSETLAARQMFLYGEGDGVRIVNVPELSEKSGCGQETIRKWLPKWNAELEEQLRNSTKLASTKILSVDEETFEKHRSDLTFLRMRLEDTKSQIESLESINDGLFRVVENLSIDPETGDKALALFDKFIRLSNNKKSLDKHFLELKKVWDDKIGIDSIKNIAESTGKAQALASAKSASEQPSENVVKVRDSVFRKRL